MDSEKNTASPAAYSRETAASFAKQIEDFKRQVDTYQEQCGTYYNQHPEAYTEEVQNSLREQNAEYARQLALYQKRYEDYCAALAAQEAAQNAQPASVNAETSASAPASSAINPAENRMPEYEAHIQPQPSAPPDPSGILLEDAPYDDSRRKRSSLDDIPAPKLERSRYDDSNRKRASLDDIQAPVLQKTDFAGERVSLGAQLDAVEAPKLEDAQFYAPAAPNPLKDIGSVAAPLLMDMSEEIKPVHVRKETEDERRAKEESKKASVRARTAMETAPQVDKEESLRMYRALKAEQDAELASKGFRLILLAALLGLGLAACIYFFFDKIEVSTQTGFFDKLRGVSLYFAGATGLLSLLMISGLGFAKSLSSLSYVASTVLMLLAITLLANCTNLKSVIPFYAGAVVLSIFLCFFINTSESVKKYFKHKNTQTSYR